MHAFLQFLIKKQYICFGLEIHMCINLIESLLGNVMKHDFTADFTKIARNGRAERLISVKKVTPIDHYTE